MSQLLKLRVEGSPGLKAQISDELKGYIDGVVMKWPELVQNEGCLFGQP